MTPLHAERMQCHFMRGGAVGRRCTMHHIAIHSEDTLENVDTPPD